MVSAALAHLEKVPKYYVALKNLVHGNVKIMFHLLMHFGGTIPRSLSFLSCMRVASTGGLSHYRQALKHVGLRINKRLLYSYLWGLILKHVACIDTWYKRSFPKSDKENFNPNPYMKEKIKRGRDFVADLVCIG